MSVDTLALTMQMQCPLVGMNPVAWNFRHRVNADGISGTGAGEIRAVCGADVRIVLGDDCPRDLDVAHQWGEPWDPDDRTDHGHDTVGRWVCPVCAAWAPPPPEVHPAVHFILEPDGTLWQQQTHR